MFDTMSEAITAFDDMLDETNEEVFGITPARIMRECDPIMYRLEFHNWLDMEGIDIDSLEDDQDLP